MPDLNSIKETVDWGFPVNWSQPLNKWLVSWYLAVSGRMGYGTTLARDLCIRNNGTCTGMAFPSTATSGWGMTTRVGGFGEMRFATAAHNYVNCGNSSQLGGVGSNSLAITAWVNLASKPGSPAFYRPIVERRLANNSGSLEFIFRYCNTTDFGSADRFEFVVSDNAGHYASVQASTFGSPSVGTWYFVAGWYNRTAATVNISVNGGAVNSAAVSITPATTSYETWIGGGGSVADTSGREMDGSLDDITIHNRALSATEVLARYQSSLAGHPRLLNRVRRYMRVGPSSGGLLLRRRRMMLSGGME